MRNIHKQNCPFFINTTWVNEQSSQPKVVNDCAPKRSVMLQMEAFNRMQGLQMSFEQQRNKTGKHTEIIVKMAQAFDTMVKNVFTKYLQIPNDEILQIDVMEGETCEERKEEHQTGS